MVKKCLFRIGFLATLLCSILLIPICAAQDSAQGAIASAKNSLKNCYDAVAQAEAAGANVDSLVATLNQAADSLSKAELAYSSGDYNGASSAASQCQSQLGSIVSDANSLKESALAASIQSSTFTIFSLVASAALAIAGIGAWITLNKKERQSTATTKS